MRMVMKSWRNDGAPHFHPELCRLPQFSERFISGVHVASGSHFVGVTTAFGHELSRR